MTRLEKMCREARQNDSLARVAAQQLRACQVNKARLAQMVSDELDRSERRRESARKERAR